MAKEEKKPDRPIDFRASVCAAEGHVRPCWVAFPGLVGCRKAFQGALAQAGDAHAMMAVGRTAGAVPAVWKARPGESARHKHVSEEEAGSCLLPPCAGKEVW